jgi:hypothetical protein
MVKKKKQKANYDVFFQKLQHYYIEFKSRSPEYQSCVENDAKRNQKSSRSEIIQEAFHGTRIQELFPAALPVKKTAIPNEEKKMWLSPSLDSREISNITNKFHCPSHYLILEVDLEKPIEILLETLQEEIMSAQEKYWSSMGDENYVGEYRFLVDFKRDTKGRYAGRIRRQRHNFEEWERYLQVFDLRYKEKRKFREIAKILFNDDAEASIDKAKKYWNRAKRLISAAAENKFPQ